MALPEAKRAFWCVPGVLVVVVQAERRGEREQGELQEGPELVRPLAELGGVGRAQQGEKERGEGGGRLASVPWTSRRPRETWTWCPRSSSASEWASYSAGVHCSVLQSASMACHGILIVPWACLIVSGGFGGE